MLFGLVIGKFVLPLFLEVIVLLVIDWKILAEVLNQMLFQEILSPSMQDPYKFIIDLLGVVIGDACLFIFSFVFITRAEGSDGLCGFG